MLKTRWIGWGLAACLLLCAGAANGAEPAFTLATMPRIDVHTHVPGDWKVMDGLLALRKAVQEQLHVDLAMWISLGRGEPPDMAELRKRYEGRVQFCINDYTIKDGLRYSPEELVRWQEQGVAGFKFYPGWEREIGRAHV